MRTETAAKGIGCIGLLFWFCIVAFNVAFMGVVIWAIIKLVAWLTGGGA